MHNLEEKIVGWRKRLQSELGFESEAADELEAHLRDRISVLVRDGIPADQAFDRSVRELGDSAAIAAEFRRLRVPWWPGSTSLRFVLFLLGGWVAVVLFGLVWLGFRDQLTPFSVFRSFAIVGEFIVLMGGCVAAVTLISLRSTGYQSRQLREVRAVFFRLTMAAAGSLFIAVLGIGISGTGTGDHATSQTAAMAVFISTVLLLIVQLPQTQLWLRCVLLPIGALSLSAAMIWANVRTPIPIGWLCIACVLNQLVVLRLQSQRPFVATGS